MASWMRLRSGGEAHGVGADLAERRFGGDGFRSGGEAVDLGACRGERVDDLGGGPAPVKGCLAFGGFAFGEAAAGFA